MPPPATLACSRCGRPVVVPAESSAEVPRCARCAPRAAEAVYEVRSPAGRASLDEPAVLDRLATGQLTGTDWVIVEGRPVLLAAHPAFAARFARGEIAEAPPLPPPAPPPPPPVVLRPVRKPWPWGTIIGSTFVIGVVAAVAFAGWTHRDRLARLAQDAGQVVKPPDAPHEVEVRPAPVDPSQPPPDPLASLAAAVGPVEEPASLLDARAVAAWATGTASGEADALDLARRGAARSTGDADAVALLAIFAAWSGHEAALTTLAAERAIDLGKGGAATQLGRAALALGNRDLAGAEAAVAPCVAAGDLICRAVAARARVDQPAQAAAGIAALDALADAWPQNAALPRLAALAAARADLPEAKARLLAIKGDDPTVLGARGALALRDGDAPAAAALLEKLGDRAPASLRVGVARAALARNDGARILKLVQDVGSAEPAEEADLRLLVAQARYLLAAKDPTALPAAKEAVAHLLELGRSDPATAQVRALVAHLGGDTAEEAKAWDSMDTSRRTGPELARVLKTQAALMLDENAPGSEILPVAEAARSADPADPYTHVWVIHVHLLGHDRGKAVDAMRQALRRVDGQAARRRTDLATLETGSPAKGLRKVVDEAVGNEATAATLGPFAGGVASWLAGDLAGARAALAPLPHLDEDPDALALRARLRTAAGDYPGAVADWDALVAIRPKESEWLLGSLQARVLAGRAKESAPLADLVRASKNTDALAPALLAEVALAGGDRPGAVQLLESAVAADALDIRARARLTDLRSGK